MKTKQPQVIKDSNSWFHCDGYTGTKEALIAEGYCKASWFPAKLEKEKGNYNPPRTKRTYTVAGVKPEMTLTHKQDREGKVSWLVRIAISPEERDRRRAEHEREVEEHTSKLQAEGKAQEEARRQESVKAFPYVDALRNRYPGVWVQGTRSEYGELFIDFYAPLNLLQGHGLITREMMTENFRITRNVDDYAGTCPHADWFSIGKEYAGQRWRLRLITYDVPKERKRIDVSDAKRVLKAIAAK